MKTPLIDAPAGTDCVTPTDLYTLEPAKCFYLPALSRAVSLNPSICFCNSSCCPLNVVLPDCLLASSYSPASANVTATMRSSSFFMSFFMISSVQALDYCNTSDMPVLNSLKNFIKYVLMMIWCNFIWRSKTKKPRISVAHGATIDCFYKIMLLSYTV